MPLGLGSKEGIWPLSRTCDSFVCRAQETLERLPGSYCCVAKQRKVSQTSLGAPSVKTSGRTLEV